MERTQIMLNKELKKKIKYKAKNEGKSMAEVVREAVAVYVTQDIKISQKRALLDMFKKAIRPKKDYLPQLNSGNYRKKLEKFLD